MITTHAQRELDAPLDFESGHVEDVMTWGVLTCGVATPLAVVARMMAAHHVHAIVVMTWAGGSERHPWGVVSDLDLVDAVGRGALDDPAGAAATTPVVTVRPRTPVLRAAQLMREYRTTHLVVVEDSVAQPVGVVSALDVARALAGRTSWPESD